MKKPHIFLIISFAFLFVTSPVFTQDKPDVALEKNVIKANALAFLVRSGSLSYEREITDLISAQFGVGYLNYSLKDIKFTGLILTPDFRMYLRKNAIDGIYLSPYLRYNKYGYEGDSSEGSLTAFGGGIAFGRQWIFRKGFVIDFFFGGHYTNSNIEVTIGTEPDITRLEGFRTRLGLCIGFAF